MNSALKFQILDEMIEVMPDPSPYWCASCEVEGDGCCSSYECRENICLKLLDVIERNGGLRT